MKKRHRVWGYAVLGLVILALGSLGFLFPELRKFGSPIFVRDFLLGLGNWGYLVFVVLLLASIPLPVPSLPVILGGGYVYGTILGSILALAGCVIGGSVSFYLVRVWGKLLLEKLVDKHHIIHFNHIFKKRGTMAAFISYAIPIFPSDAVSLLLGLTKMKWKTFLFLVGMGSIPRLLVINSLGEDLYKGLTGKTLAVLLLGAVFVLIVIFRERLKKILFKELKELENEVEIVEEEVGLVKEKERNEEGRIKVRMKREKNKGVERRIKE